jgi:hypothetical protein
MRPQFKIRPRVAAGVVPEGVMTPLEKLEELGSICIRFSCRMLHNVLLLLQKFGLFETHFVLTLVIRGESSVRTAASGFPLLIELPCDRQKGAATSRD